MVQKAIEKIKNQSKGNAVLLAIGDYLISFMKREPAFAEKVMNEKKSMKAMLQYVMSEAKKQATGGAACLKDDVVFGMAVHYFDEKDLKFKPVVGTVATSKSVKAEEKRVKKAEDKPASKVEPVKKAEPKKEKKEDVLMSIFDFMGE